jgi:hypothetical protein
MKERIIMATAQTRRQEYEAEKAALDAVNAPASAYARLDQAFFGDTSAAPAGLVAWMGRNILYVLPALIAAGSMFVFVIIEGPRDIVHGITGWAMGLAELHTAQGNAAIITTTAPYAGPKAAAETATLTATAHYAELQAQANAEKAQAEARQAEAGAAKAEADARLAKMQACKVQAEAEEASGINKYDVPKYLDADCRKLLNL